ncbi:MAG: D-alanyl-D-alanine carboxypeptidase/D-alanyl-D-alanine-endopeptidase [Acidimicrobiales bacterium]
MPSALLVLSLGCGIAAWVVEGAVPTAGPAVGGDRLVTPVVSVRRIPTVVAEPIADRRLRGDLEAWAATAPAGSCAVVRDTEGGEVLDHRGDAPMVPASTLKLLTATAVLEQLGPDHRFRTVAVGPPPVGGVVPGDLVLVGGGDPILASPAYAGRFERQPQIFTNLETLAADLAAAGIRQVAGSVVGDESRYDGERYVAGWPARYLSQQVVGPLSGLSVNDGFVDHPTATEPRPLVPAPDPAVQAAGVLTGLLEARGIDVVGDPRSGGAAPGSPELAAIESEPVAQVLAQLLLESDNSTAELLVKELGRDALDPTTPGGLARVRALLDEAGVDLTGAVLADGSGLSLENRVTCDQLMAALTLPDSGALVRTLLPVAGSSGTLTKAFLDTPLEGQLAAKTGSLNTVAALAGVVEDDDGPMTFAYLVNVPEGESIDLAVVAASQQALGEVLLSWPRVPDVDVLGPRSAEPR